jgi:hypothetical protein
MAQTAQLINMRRETERRRVAAETEEMSHAANGWRAVSSPAAKPEKKKKITLAVSPAPPAPPAATTSKANGKCVVCFDKEISQLMTPCMHIATCKECAGRIMASATKSCPVCRGAIVSLSTIYICTAEGDDAAT